MGDDHSSPGIEGHT